MMKIAPLNQTIDNLALQYTGAWNSLMNAPSIA